MRTWRLGASAASRVCATEAPSTLAAAGGFDRNGLDHQRPVGHQEGIAQAVGRLEVLARLLQRAERHFERGVGALVLQVQATLHGNVGLGHVLAPQFAHGLSGQLVQLTGQRLHQRGVQHLLDGFLAHVGLVGQAHAIGRQHATQRVREHRGHAQGVGHQAGVLPAGAAKGGQRVLGHVVAALHRNALDGLGHVAHGDFQEAFGQLLGRHLAPVAVRTSSAMAVKRATTASRSSGSLASGPNTLGKKSGWILPSSTLQSVTASGPPRR